VQHRGSVSDGTATLLGRLAPRPRIDEEQAYSRKCDDEATSPLDHPSERLAQQALRTILAGRTSAIIAHRLSTLEIADRVLVREYC
jgi:hypothetical protein